MERNGIISAGNWLIDHVKITDSWPNRGNLSNIVAEPVKALGGCAHNVLVGLARLQAGIPLWAGGIVGDDDNGAFVMNEIANYGIDSTFMQQSKQAATSFTDVISERETGCRTFFHYRGANALLDYPDFIPMDTPAKIFHLGYLLLLDKLDIPDEQYGTVAAKVLHLLQEKGYATSIDVVSEQGSRFRNIVSPALKYTDYIICNEVEAGACANIPLREGNALLRDNLPAAAEALLESGVSKMAIIHFPEGGFAMEKSGNQLFVSSFAIPSSGIKSTVGAGDAFCTGALYAIHEDMPVKDVLTFANANAYFNLLSESCTGGAVPLKQLKEFIIKYVPS